MEAAKFSMVPWPDYCDMDKENKARVIAFRRASLAIEEYARKVLESNK